MPQEEKIMTRSGSHLLVDRGALFASLAAVAGLAVVSLVRQGRKKKDPEIDLGNGIVVNECSPGLARVIYDQVVDYFEHPDGGAPPSIFRDGMYVLDVGMNIGLFSIELLRRAKGKGLSATVVGFEPIPATYGYAKNNLAKQGFLEAGSKQVAKPLNVGCSSEPGTVTFTHLPGWSARSSMMSGGMSDYDKHHWTDIDFMTENLSKLPDAYRGLVPLYVKVLPRPFAKAWHAVFYGNNSRLGEPEEVEAKLVTLSSIIGDEPIVDLLKVDVEKAELLVLKGLSKEDWTKINAAVLEVHDEGYKLKEIKELMTDAGLTIQRQVQEGVFEGTDVYTLICSRPPQK